MKFKIKIDAAQLVQFIEKELPMVESAREDMRVVVAVDVFTRCVEQCVTLESVDE